MNGYKKFLVQMHDLSKNHYHKEIMQTINWYIGKRGYKFETALEMTMRKKRRLFEEIMDGAQSEDDTGKEGGEETEEDQESESEQSEEDEESESGEDTEEEGETEGETEAA
jgi:hypothetical protein